MDSNIVGGKFTLDVSDLKKGLADANRQIRLASSEFQASAASMEDWTKSEEGLNAKLKQLTTTTEVQKQKVSALQSEYNKLIANGLDPTSKEAQTLQIRINNETKALNQNSMQLQDTQKKLDEFGKEVDDAKKSVQGLGEKSLTVGDLIKGNLISEAIIGGFKALAGAAKEVVSGLISIGKSAVESYAEYEQLVGGVDTLFKESSKQVQDYANNAYKTAGLSANEYMSTVTGFSASLLQSLGGDTEKAAKYADRAVTDMSDNANKMGTDMSMIQNAYQGFAKQNYTMLDNLKLGYGGTKTEMERLLVDAGKISGQKFDITSYADVTEAIHVMQESMGIAGTTAKEATETISGSVNAMKSAWGNLLTGLADENADLTGLIDNLVDSVTTVGKNILPVVTQTIKGIAQLISELVPEIIDMIPNLLNEVLPELINAISSLLTAIVSALPQIIETIMKIIPELVQALLNAVPQLITALIQITDTILTQLGVIIPQIITAIVAIIPQIVQALVNGLPLLIHGAVQLLMGIVQALPTIIEALTTALPQIINTILNAFITAMPVILDGAIQLFNALITAIPIMLEKLLPELPKIIDTIVNYFITAIPILLQAAIQLLMAIIDALPTIIRLLIVELPKITQTISKALINAMPTILQAAVQLLGEIVKAIPKIIVELAKQVPEIISTIVEGIGNGLASMSEAGLNLIKGLWEGIKGAKDWLLEKIKGFAKTITKGIKDFFGIKSPSKLFRDEIGVNLAKGIGVGFDKEMGGVKKSMQGSLKGLTASLNSSIGLNGVGNVGVNGQNGINNGGKTVIVNQTITSPKALSQSEIYRNTKSIATTVALAK